MLVGRSPQIEGALAEWQRYLQNEIPPDAGAGTVALLMAQPPDVVMQHVGAWSIEQARKHSAPVSDLLVHALKKIYIMGELDLLDREAIANYLDRVTGLAIRLCADDEERAQLRSKLTAMRASKTTTANTVRAAPPPPPPPPPPAPIAVDDEDAHIARRLELILERLGAPRGDSGQPAAPADPQALAQMLTMAATSSKSGQQLNAYMDQIRPLAGAAGGNVFVILGGALPSWDIPAQPGTGKGKPPAQIGAMERIIDLADPTATMDRFRELVNAAVDKFNDGSLAATLWMLDVAQDTITEKNLEVLTVNKICAEAADRISSVQLRKYVENKRQHAALRIALDFFPTLHIASLFRDLRGEAKAEKRRSLLGHIEAQHGRGREYAMNELEGELERSDTDTYYLRNLIYLLHRIPHEGDEGDARELAALERASARGQNIYVIKEAATALGRIKTDATATILTTRLAEFEAILLRSDVSTYPLAEMRNLLDRLVGSLARIGTPGAMLTVARHGMKANPLLGDTRARLAGLSQHDLSFEQAAVDVLLKALRSEIPGKLLGRLLPKKQDGTVQLIEALSGTRSDEVEDLFRDIAQRFPQEEIGRAAAKALDLRTAAKQPPARSEVATLAGELEFFGLPSVMQSLGDMRATGMLTLSTKQGQAVAGLAFVEGRFLNAQKGSLRGVDALYEILERPLAGKFAFVPHPIEKMKSTLEPQEIIPLLLEGVRRHDELQQLIALIPDGLKLAKGTVKPTPHEDETDPSLVREIWLKASSSATLGEWGSQLATDSYRIRRLIAHWLETGALVQT